MNQESNLDCVVIGYNEVPFDRYERFLRNYGEDTEAYRDLKFSFVNIGGAEMDYMGLMNHSLRLPTDYGRGLKPPAAFKSGALSTPPCGYLTQFLRKPSPTAEYI